jgi:putative ABC transport system permease protein
MNNFRYAFRQLLKSPGFTAVAVATLALGIGAATAIFSVVHALLLSPLQYHDADRLVMVQSQHPEQGIAGLAPATFGDLVAQAHSFEGFAAQEYYYYNVTKVGTPVSVTGAKTNADYFRVFGATPLLGRTWQPNDTASGATPVVVLSYSFWQKQFGGAPGVINQTVLLNDVAYTVIGVMPKSFKDPFDNARFWVPIPSDSEEAHDRSARYWNCFARLRAGVSLAQTDTELATIAHRLEAIYGEHYRGWTLRAVDLQGLVLGNYRTGLLVILSAVACIMFITCANIAGLTIVRATARRRELAIRTALGASRGQILRQLLAESLVLALPGGILGVLLASWGIDALLASSFAASLPRADEIAINLPVLTAALGLTLVTGLSFGLAPGFSAARIESSEALKDNARASSGPTHRRMRSGLVVAEIAIALILLVGAGLLGRSFLGILSKQPGIDAERLLSLTIVPSEKHYDSRPKRLEFYERAQAATAALPGVQAAAFTETSPFRWGKAVSLLPAVRNSAAAPNDVPLIFFDSVSVDYFKTVGSRLIAGRYFADTDNAQTHRVAIISESAARFFGSDNPIGRELVNAADNTYRLEIVGVVRDIRRSGLAEDVPLQAYSPLAQRPPAFATLMVRTTLPPASVAKSVEAALWRIDPDAPVSDVSPMENVISATVAQPRLYLTLFGLFAGFALLLAVIGIYGLVAYSVAQRRREFGIRSALGASAGELLALVLREGAILIGLGLTIGLAGAWMAARLLQSMVVETSVHDPLTLGAVALLLGAVGLAACLLPARRASKINPVNALRYE